ncbi:hypothetical protein ColLi_12152 [Colletotrichum liriopes]|uniref:Uncharacterized protein n=1 Tax=Colletotrichum liriopes TaxID=708192 RepID=A0AA37GYP4_9PEZI|nr:hypothetical protein ColLi_12152 [Colletotrichum liriopes]
MPIHNHMIRRDNAQSTVDYDEAIDPKNSENEKPNETANPNVAVQLVRTKTSNKISYLTTVDVSNILLIDSLLNVAQLYNKHFVIQPAAVTDPSQYTVRTSRTINVVRSDTLEKVQGNKMLATGCSSTKMLETVAFIK